MTFVVIRAVTEKGAEPEQITLPSTDMPESAML